MKINLRLIAPLLAAGAAAAIVAAPTAAAETHLDCAYLTTDSTQCESPGNVQLSSSPPDVDYPQYPFLYGGLVFGHGFDHGHGSGIHPMGGPR
jgi:hypothetical protein